MITGINEFEQKGRLESAELEWAVCYVNNASHPTEKGYKKNLICAERT